MLGCIRNHLTLEDRLQARVDDIPAWAFTRKQFAHGMILQAGVRRRVMIKSGGVSADSDPASYTERNRA